MGHPAASVRARSGPATSRAVKVLLTEPISKTASGLLHRSLARKLRAAQALRLDDARTQVPGAVAPRSA